MILGPRPWDPPLLEVSEHGTLCARCGNGNGEMRTDHVGVWHIHGDDCVTGRPAYDLHTHLMLERPSMNGRGMAWPAGPLTTVFCSNRHPETLGRIYQQGGELLLIARHLSHLTRVHGVPTYRQEQQIPVLLDPATDAIHGLLSCRCTTVDFDSTLARLLRARALSGEAIVRLPI